MLLSISPALLLSGCGLAGIFASGPIAKNVIQNAQETGDALIANARNAGDALEVKAANELSVAANNAAITVGTDLNKKVGALSTENRLLLSRLEELTSQSKTFKTSAFELKESTYLDITTLTGDLARWSQYDFLLQSIRGITQLQKPDGTYVLTFVGIGFGTDSSKRSQAVKAVQVGDNALSSFRENKVRAYTSEISIPASVFGPFGKERAISIIPIVITVEVISEHPFGKQSHFYKVPVSVTLMPKVASAVTVTWTEPIMEWVTVNSRQEFTGTTDDHNQHGDVRQFPFTFSNKVDDNHQFAEPVSCQANTFAETQPNCQYSRCNGVKVLGGGKSLTLNGDSWGSPCTYHYWAPLQEYKPTGEKSVVKQYDLIYGEHLVVELPLSTTFWKIQGKNASFETIDVVARTSDANLKFQDLISSGPVQRAVYLVSTPDGVGQ
ncbi:hypothetical protein [Tunturiibacter lichenicola]|uniref:hypothetical protein n=1 Tax=Tunturiibacter lichenicola TaxID=2051959 RepID=UPI003D9B3AC9